MALLKREDTDYPSLVEDTKRALELVKNILSSQKSPRVFTTSEFHVYEDKYALCDFLGTVALNAIFGLFELIGLDVKHLRSLHDTVQQQGKGITVRFVSKCQCEFLEEYEAKKEMMTHVVEYDISKKDTTSFNPSIPFITKKTQHNASVESRTFVKVKEYRWKFSLEYKIYVFVGNEDDADAENSIVLKHIVSSCQLVNTGKKEPPVDVVPLTLQRDLYITSLIRKFVPNQAMFSFSIDRTNESCRTPRRNPQIEECQSNLQAVAAWFTDIILHLQKCESLCSQNYGESVSPSSTPKLSSLDDKDVFNPIIPLLIAKTSVETADDSGSNIAQSSAISFECKDTQDLLAYHSRSMKEKMQVIGNLFPAKSSTDQHILISLDDAQVTLVARNAVSLVHRWQNCVDYIESMLHEQLTSAIGKEISSSDLRQFARFYNQTFFADPYTPEPFSYAIRRPDHYPDGIISIESVENLESMGESTSSSFQPIYTLTRKVSGENFDTPLKIPINAATTVQCTCDRYLHGWVRQTFQEDDDVRYQLAARARQFSSFLLIIGTLAGPDLFDPEHAIIVQNKDEILIPLILNTLPSSKEFKDAISSLSPEQQDFAKAFRKRQLSSSVFGVCVVQLKPQLELLLGLPEDSLTKEIRLMQELLQLFIEYQIPSDLLSFDGIPNAALTDKVTTVKGYVKAVMNVIEQAKQDSLDQAKNAAEMNIYQTFSNIPPELPKRMLKYASVPVTAPCPAPMACFDTGPIVFEPQSAVYQARSVPQRDETVVAYENDFLDEIASLPSADNEDYTSRVQENIVKQSASKNNTSDASNLEGLAGSVDFTKVPHHLDTQFENDYNMKATIIKTGDTWLKKSQANLLSKLTESNLRNKEKKSEKDKAFDLLDAMSRSGTLPISCAEFHVVVATTQNYAKSIIDTIVQENINPISQMELANTVVASAIQGDIPVRNLLRNEDDFKRLVAVSSGRHRCLCYSTKQE
jgi:hypothetical protein